jgi:hypothetical protein
MLHYRERRRPEPKAVALTFDDGPHQVRNPDEQIYFYNLYQIEFIILTIEFVVYC